MAGHKDYPPLTGEQQRLVERAWAETRPLRRHLCRQYPQIGFDVDGLIAEAMCKRIHRYDPARSSIGTWARYEAWYEMKREFARRNGYRTGNRAATGWYRLNAKSLWGLSTESHERYLGVLDPPSPMEIEEEIAARKAMTA